MLEVTRNPPLPLILGFLACEDIFKDDRTGMSILTVPPNRWLVETFPARIRLSVWLEFTGGHGDYLPSLRMLNMSDEVVWKWDNLPPMKDHDPLTPHKVNFHGLRIDVPEPGRYRLVLLLNEEEAAQRNLWVSLRKQPQE